MMTTKMVMKRIRTTNSIPASTTTTPCSPTPEGRVLSVRQPQTIREISPALLAAPRTYSRRLTLTSDISATDAPTVLNEDGSYTLVLAVTRSHAEDAYNERSVSHAVAKVEGVMWWQSCCRATHNWDETCLDNDFPSCFMCIACKGCIACKDNMINDDTTFMGPWVTAKKKRVWPFQMDNSHLINAIRKLHRDKHHFKNDWRSWAACLEAEANLRSLAW